MKRLIVILLLFTSCYKAAPVTCYHCVFGDEDGTGYIRKPVDVCNSTWPTFTDKDSSGNIFQLHPRCFKY